MFKFTTVNLIVCKAKNNVIGINNEIPWDFKEDMSYFKKLTLHKPVIMGKNTFLSLKKPLKNRLNIVITTTATEETKNFYKDQGVLMFGSLNCALNYLNNEKYPECFIIGGSYLYKEALKKCDYLYVTELDRAYKGDTKFPRIPFTYELINSKRLVTTFFDAYFLKYKHTDSKFKAFKSRLKFRLSKGSHD